MNRRRLRARLESVAGEIRRRLLVGCRGCGGYPLRVTYGEVSMNKSSKCPCCGMPERHLHFRKVEGVSIAATIAAARKESE
jgi:hypothetical protein